MSLLRTIAALLILATNPAPARAATVAGRWQTVVPVVITSYHPSPNDLIEGTYQGVGSTAWLGTWNGVTHYTIQGKANLVTGAGSGTIDETFYGCHSERMCGTIGFVEDYALDAAGHITIRARIVDATSGFAGAKGVVEFTGTETSLVGGSGSYTGSWVS